MLQGVQTVTNISCQKVIFPSLYYNLTKTQLNDICLLGGQCLSPRPDIVIFRYEVSDIDLSMARLQLIDIVSRAQYRQNAFLLKKKIKSFKFMEKRPNLGVIFVHKPNKIQFINK